MKNNLYLLKNLEDEHLVGIVRANESFESNIIQAIQSYYEIEVHVVELYTDLRDYLCARVTMDENVEEFDLVPMNLFE